MSATISIATALRSSRIDWRGSGWRAVESQSQVATLELVQGNLADQRLLEDLIEAVKPPVLETARKLHWLLFTPFRYRPGQAGSRFRAPDAPPVFYGARERKTACAEIAYWRLRFARDSAALRGRAQTLAMTLFSFHAAGAALDLTQAPFQPHYAALTAPLDYTACQSIAAQARAAGVEVLLAPSARHSGGVCLALLSPEVFLRVNRPYRGMSETWSLYLRPPAAAIWQAAHRDVRFAFTFGAEHFPAQEQAADGADGAD